MTAEVITTRKTDELDEQEKKILQALTDWANSVGGIRVEEIDLVHMGTFSQLGYTSGWRVITPFLGWTDAERLHSIVGDEATMNISADASTIDKYALPMIQISVYIWG